MADPNEYYQQLRKMHAVDPEQIDELKRKTILEDRRKQVNEMSVNLVKENKTAISNGKSGAPSRRVVTREQNNADGNASSPLAPNNSVAPNKPLKVNREEFPEEIDFTAGKHPGVSKP